MRRYYIVIFALLAGCTPSDRNDIKYTSPPGYNLDAAARFHVRQSMDEISGLILAPDEHHILAINDEQGRVFAMDIQGDKPYPSWKFEKSGDYEDIASDGKHLMVLKSNGHLYEVLGMYTDTTNSNSYKLHGAKKNEFESLYYDARTNSMVLICKNCGEDKHEMQTSAFRFNMDTREFEDTPAYRISVDTLAKLLNEPLTYFKPSAAAIHPIEKRLYILSAVNRLLVVTDLDGHVQEAHHLRRSIFKQPEGIAFLPNGDMFISNESADESSANILKFTYHPSSTK
jgi:hypothetical protein